MKSNLWAFTHRKLAGRIGYAKRVSETQGTSSAEWTTTFHALFSLPATMSIANGVQLLKANSSGWMNEVRSFEWQEGYFACSVSRSQIPRVMKYIANQRKHHKTIDHADEMARLLRMHGFDPPKINCAVPHGTRNLAFSHRCLPYPATGDFFLGAAPASYKPQCAFCFGEG